MKPLVIDSQVALDKWHRGQAVRLPLWRLEMLHAQALRKFQRTEKEHRDATRELERIRKEIDIRRKETHHEW